MTKTKVAYSITKNMVVVSFNGETRSVQRGSPDYDRIVAALKAEDYDVIPALLSRAKFVEYKSGGKFRVVNGEVYYEDGKKLPTLLNSRVIEFLENDLPFKHLVRFGENLNMNPSQRSVEQLFGFLEKNKHPITPDGKFIAYKKVRRGADGRLRDIHSGTFLNNPGDVCEMPRDKVDPDPNRTCSNGLHVSNWDYARNHFGSSEDVMLEVEVDPCDAVSVPTDYNQSKMRVCRYVVRAIVENPNENLHIVDNDAIDATETCTDELPEPEEQANEALCETCDGDGELECEGCCDGSSYCSECYGIGFTVCPDCDGDGVAAANNNNTAQEHDQGCEECCSSHSPSEDFAKNLPMPRTVSRAVKYYTKEDVRKMSSARLHDYINRLENIEPESKKSTKAWEKAMKAAREVLDFRTLKQ